MDDVTQYVLVALAVLVLWFGVAMAGGYVIHRHAARRKRLFRGHASEEE